MLEGAGTRERLRASRSSPISAVSGFTLPAFTPPRLHLEVVTASPRLPLHILELRKLLQCVLRGARQDDTRGNLAELLDGNGDVAARDPEKAADVEHSN